MFKYFVIIVLVTYGVAGRSTHGTVTDLSKVCILTSRSRGSQRLSMECGFVVAKANSDLECALQLEMVTPCLDHFSFEHVLVM